jgi:EAL and modified HD-GYP domain-containing signal transduction protein
MAMSSDTLPLITLHPIADGQHRWSGYLVQCDASLEPAARTPALVRLFGEFGLFEALGPLPCVLPLTHVDDLVPDLADLLPAGQVILRLPVAHCADPSQAPRLAQLRQQGFHILADGVPAAGAVFPPEVQALAIACCSPEQAASLKPWLEKLSGPHLALQVDKPDCLKECQTEGFRWIAGNYPLNTPPAKAVAANPGRAVMLKLLAQITSDATSNEIEKTLKQDPQLSYQLLKLVNSVAFSLTNKINSFSQAITLLGRRQLQRWLQLLLYARPHGSGNEASPLMPRAALRAGLMEGLSRASGGSKEEQDRAFMVGMFSLLEPLIGQPAAEVVKSLNLAEEVSLALATRHGRLGQLLVAIETGEQGPSPQSLGALAAVGISPAIWAKEQAQACNWAIQVSREA